MYLIDHGYTLFGFLQAGIAELEGEDGDPQVDGSVSFPKLKS